MIGLALTIPTAVTWLYFIALDGAPAALQQGAYTAGKCMQFALPLVGVALLGRPERLTAPRGDRWLLVGLGLGLLIAAAMAALYCGWLRPAGLLDEAGEAVRAKVKSFGAGSLAAYLALSLFYAAVHSLLEEYYWRWFVFGQLAALARLPAAILVASLGFAAHHVLVLAHYFGAASPLTWLFAAGVAIGGGLWSLLYRASGSLYAPWLSHALVDAAIFAIGYDLLAG